jgi:DNA-directed RNA polymerase subunit K/omega
MPPRRHREVFVIYRNLESNPFEFAVVAALRAKQLMAGCVPRVPPAPKFTSTASLEVRAGKVVRLPDLPLLLASEPRDVTSAARPLAKAPER